MADTLKRLMTDETGQQIAQKLSEQNSLLGILAKKEMNLQNTWDQIADIVNAGNAESIFSVGDLLSDKYINVDNSNKEYEMPWHINDFRDFELESGDTVHGMILQSQYTTLQAVQFTNVRAFLVCPDGLSAGTYHLDFAQNWGNNAKKGITYQFTLTKDVPAGGRLAGFKYMPDSAPSSWKVYSYLEDAKTLAETVNVTEGSGGTNLGTLAYSSRTGNLNSMQETAYGRNRWSTSAIRQWLNSEKGKGEWWTPTDEFDIAPDQLATMSGFLCGLPEELKNKIKTVKVATFKNTVQEGGGIEYTYDKVFLPSLEEMYITKQNAGEGAYHKYWKIRAGATTPVSQYKENDRYKNYALENHTSAQYVRLRSAGSGIACGTWHIDPSGRVHNGNATNAYRALPLIVI